MKAPILGISRHRVLTDGDGITTLVAFYGCPLDCRYCVNPQCKHTPAPEDYYTPESLLEAVAAGQSVGMRLADSCLLRFIRRFGCACAQRR